MNERGNNLIENKSYTQLLYELFPFAVEAGIDAREYWFYTITEINTTIIGYRKRLATKAAMDYRMVDLVGASVGRLIDKSIKFPTFNEAYPAFQSDLKPGRSEPQDKYLIIKDRLLRYAEANNAKRRGE